MIGYIEPRTDYRVGMLLLLVTMETVRTYYVEVRKAALHLNQ